MYDPEVPAGYQEADLLQAQYEAESRQYRRDIANGICHHSSQLGRRVPAYYTAEDIAEMRRNGHFPDRPTDPRVGDQSTIPDGLALCQDCGELVPDMWPD